MNGIDDSAGDSELLGNAERPVGATRASHRSRTLAVLMGIVMLATATHALWLKQFALAFIATDSARGADAILVLRGDGGLEIAAQRLANGDAETVLLVRQRRSRLMRLGVVPLHEEVWAQRLTELGVAPQRIETIALEARTTHDVARSLAVWLSDNEARRVVVLCDRFTSRDTNAILGRHLGPKLRSRVGVEGIPDRRYDESNWWRSSAGIKAFFRAAFDLTMTHIRGEEPALANEWSPDEYERSLP